VEPSSPWNNLVFFRWQLVRKGEGMIEAIIERCAGIDVGKKFLLVCVMTGSLEAEPQVEIRKFGTIVAELQALRDWLISTGCTHAVMESTGSYWKPVFNILEDSIRVVLANAFDVRNRRGHKTDPNDSRWLAHLLRHGMIRPGFVPEKAIRELRDLTRRRKQLVGESSRERNRIQKTLEDSNVKLGDVLTDVFGLSGRMMINALRECHTGRGDRKASATESKEKGSGPDRRVTRESSYRTPSLCPAERIPASRFP
jgi:transposase